MIAIALLAAGVLCWAAGALRRRSWERTARLAELLDLPGEPIVPLGGLSTARLGRVVEVLGLAVRSDGAPVTRTDASLADRTAAMVALGGVALVVGAVVGLLTNQILLGSIAGACVVGSVVVVQRRRVSTRRRRIEEQFPEALVVMAASLEAGNPLIRALQMLASTGPQPLAGEIALVVAETELGTPITDAVDRMAARVGIPDIGWFARSLRIQQSVGGQLAPLVRTVADVMTARAELQREARVLTAEGRLSAWVLGALPLLLVLAVQAMNPDYLAPMLRGWGLVVLACCAASVAAGIACVLRMVDLGEQR